MESFPIQFCRGIRSYWRSRKYQKLRSSGTKTTSVVRFGGGRKSPGSTRRFKLRSFLKIRIRAFNPVRILARIRDAYVDAMLGVAGKAGSSLTGSASMVSRRIPKARSVRAGPSDFESRLIMEIYKSVMSSKELVAYS